MAKNLEIKLSLDSHEDVKAILIENKCKRSGVLNQKDTYYEWKKGLLKLRSVNGVYEFIKYNRDESGADRWSDYTILNISDETAETFFKEVLEVETIVMKKRELYLYKNTRIHLDEVDKLGYFLELETVVTGNLDEAKQEFGEVMNLLKLDKSQQILASYRNLMLAE